jgi:thymidylate synthase
MEKGIDKTGTKFLYNVGFYILEPWDNHITTSWRKWSKSYAEAEWEWYLSEKRDAREMAKRAPIWKDMMDGNFEVMSNYGWQWNRGSQLENVIVMLQDDPTTRRAVISIYDGKEMHRYGNDTPCTLTIHFAIYAGKLCMSVNMRSNDLVFGFCNDQYCFSKLQMIVAKKLDLPIGWYHHFVHDMHIYERHFNMKHHDKR